MKLSLAISHTPWVPERVKSFERLCHQLRVADTKHFADRVGPQINEHVRSVRFETTRAPNWRWSEYMWQWSAETQSDWCVFLQDDVIVAPNFWPALEAMLSALPDQGEIVGLQVPHPVAPALAEEGYRFFTTTDALIGVGYVVRGPTLEKFLAWRRDSLKVGAIQAITEDTLLGLFAACTGRKIWHPLPTIIDHDLSLESSYSNDSHQHRRSLVRWDNMQIGERANMHELLTEPRSWFTFGPHVGRFYKWTANLAATYVSGWSPVDYARLVADNGYSELRSLSRRRAARLPEPEHRVVIATRSRAFCHEDHKATIAKLVGMPDVYVDARFSVDRVQARGADVVRASSILVRDFLQETDGTHLFFVDSDVSFEPEMLRGMLAAKVDFIAAPYPSRDEPERASASYRLHLLDDETLSVGADGAAEVRHMPLGACLLTRECLQAMCCYYDHHPSGPLRFRDRDGSVAVALFMLFFEHGELWSEDFSFCERWRRMDRKVWMYLGPGSPATHHGDHAFVGKLEHFGLRRA